jgi:hypothetical protein
MKILAQPFHLFDPFDGINVEHFSEMSPKCKSQDYDLIFVHSVDLSYFRLGPFLQYASGGKKNIVVWMMDGTNNGLPDIKAIKDNVLCVFSHMPFINDQDKKAFKDSDIDMFYLPNAVPSSLALQNKGNLIPIKNRHESIGFCAQDSEYRLGFVNYIQDNTNHIVSRGKGVPESHVLPYVKMCLNAGATHIDGNLQTESNEHYIKTKGVIHRHFASVAYGAVLLAEYDTLLLEIYDYDEMLMFENKQHCVELINKYIDDCDFLQETANKAFNRLIHSHLSTQRFKAMVQIAQRHQKGLPVANRNIY